MNDVVFSDVNVTLRKHSEAINDLQMQINYLEKKQREELRNFFDKSTPSFLKKFLSTMEIIGFISFISFACIFTYNALGGK